MKCVAIVKPAGGPIQVMWQLGMDRSHVHARRGLIGDVPESGKQDMTSLQTVLCHIAGMRALSYWKR